MNPKVSQPWHPGLAIFQDGDTGLSGEGRGGKGNSGGGSGGDEPVVDTESLTAGEGRTAALPGLNQFWD